GPLIPLKILVAGGSGSGTPDAAAVTQADLPGQRHQCNRGNDHFTARSTCATPRRTDLPASTCSARPRLALVRRRNNRSEWGMTVPLCGWAEPAARPDGVWG